MMQIHNLAAVYQAKSDEELFELGAAREQLTSEAQLALDSELSRRQILAAGTSGSSRDKETCGDAFHAVSSEDLQNRGRQNVSDFMAEVLWTYHGHFWLLFKITVPAAVIGTIAIMTARNESREILRNLPRGAAMLAYHTELLEMWSVNFLAWIVSWMAFCCAFGAICIALEEGITGFAPSAWRSLLNIRERLGPFLLLSVLLFGLALWRRLLPCSW